MFEIEKGVPLPEAKNRRRTKYPWNEMEVGDSFFAPANGESSIRLQNNLLGNGRSRLPRKFTSRQENGGVRIWRIA